MDDLHTALTGGDLPEKGGEKGSRQKHSGESGMDLFLPLCTARDPNRQEG